MEYELISSCDQGILEITLSGKAGIEKAVEIVSKVANLVKTYQPKAVLFDVQLIQDRLDVLGTYHLVHTYPKEIPHIKTAIVDRRENKDIWNFYETVSDNAGYITRYFTDGTTARAWLKS
jgi:alpha-L-fucosidase